MLPIKAVWWISLLDWPGQIVAVVFLGGCNFRCPFCYNIDLVLRPGELPNLKEDDVLDKLKERVGFLDGVVLSGGEPTLYHLEDFLKKIKKLGLKIGLETNGSQPEVLEKLISQKLVDAVFMDIKGPIEDYEKIVRVKIDKEKIKRSVDLIKNSPKIESEFRTTVVPGLLKKDDIEKIGKWLKISNLKTQNSKFIYRLQQFRNERTLDPKFQKIKPYSEEELEEMREIAKKYFRLVENFS